MLLVLAGSWGCTAQIVEKRPPRKGPVAEVGYVDTGRGEVKYSVEGWGFVVGWRRKTALREARKVCLGFPYKIIDEFTRQDMEVPYAQAPLDATIEKGHKHYRINPFNHILFDCEPPAK